jgi:hypothetical protein
LVGANDGAKSLELIVNKECKADVNMIQQQVVSELKFPGTCKAYYIGDGYEVSLSGGYQVNAGFVKRWKRMPARTYRSTLLAYCTSPGAEILPILKLDVGLEVSICTGNSRRVSLWGAIQLSQAKQEGVGCEYKQVFCCHPVGSIECISNCWNWAARGEIDRTLDLPGDHEDFNRASARRKLINAILALEHTGINHQGQLQALWPFSGCPQVLHIPSSTKRQKHSWISLVKDTTDSSTFAVLSQRCLELRYPPSNVCPSPCFKPDIMRPTPTVFCTRVFPCPSDAAEFKHAKYLRICEESLEVVDRHVGDPMAVVVKKSGVRGWIPQGTRIQEHTNPSNLVKNSTVMVAF